MKVNNRQELMDAIAGVIMGTPEEFIDFENVVFDIGDEFIIDGDPKKEYYPGAKVELVKTYTMTFKIPVNRRSSVYAYYADRLDDDIDGRKEAIEEMRKLKELYQMLGKVE